MLMVKADEQDQERGLERQKHANSTTRLRCRITFE
jgi:hypothetical protein